MTSTDFFLDTTDLYECLLVRSYPDICQRGILPSHRIESGQAMSTSYCIPCTTTSFGTTKTANSANTKRITTDKSQKQQSVNPTTTRWPSSNHPMNSAVAKKKTSGSFTCPTNYMQSSTAPQRTQIQQTANKTYTNSYGLSRQPGSGNRFSCYG